VRVQPQRVGAREHRWSQLSTNRVEQLLERMPRVVRRALRPQIRSELVPRQPAIAGGGKERKQCKPPSRDGDVRRSPIRNGQCAKRCKSEHADDEKRLEGDIGLGLILRPATYVSKAAFRSRTKGGLVRLLECR